ALQLAPDPQTRIHKVVGIADDDGGGNAMTMLTGARRPPAWTTGSTEGDHARWKIDWLLHYDSLNVICDLADCELHLFMIRQEPTKVKLNLSIDVIGKIYDPGMA